MDKSGVPYGTDCIMTTMASGDRVVRRVTWIAVMAACWLGAVPAMGVDCIDELSGRENNCTADDVRIAALTVVQGGIVDDCAYPGDFATVDTQAILVAGAAARRCEHVRPGERDGPVP